MTAYRCQPPEAEFFGKTRLLRAWATKNTTTDARKQRSWRRREASAWGGEEEQIRCFSASVVASAHPLHVRAKPSPCARSRFNASSRARISSSLRSAGQPYAAQTAASVSYTHLDVYKRQQQHRTRRRFLSLAPLQPVHYAGAHASGASPTCAILARMSPFTTSPVDCLASLAPFSSSACSRCSISSLAPSVLSSCLLYTSRCV